MNKTFSLTLSELRKSKGLSQRAASSDLHISQALLSHYENGSREPGLSFVSRACDYYGVSADYLLGRSDDKGQVSSIGGGRFDAACACLVSCLRELSCSPLEDAAESYLTAVIYKALIYLSGTRDAESECAFDMQRTLSELCILNALHALPENQAPAKYASEVSKDMDRIKSLLKAFDS